MPPVKSCRSEQHTTSEIFKNSDGNVINLVIFTEYVCIWFEIHLTIFVAFVILRSNPINETTLGLPAGWFVIDHEGHIGMISFIDFQHDHRKKWSRANIVNSRSPPPFFGFFWFAFGGIFGFLHGRGRPFWFGFRLHGFGVEPCHDVRMIIEG